MRLHMASAGLGPIGPKPLRPYARAYAYRGLTASCFALPWRSAVDVSIYAMRSLGNALQ